MDAVEILGNTTVECWRVENEQLLLDTINEALVFVNGAEILLNVLMLFHFSGGSHDYLE